MQVTKFRMTNFWREYGMLIEERKKKMNRIEIFTFGFLTLIKVSGTYRINLARE